jgi:polysaccharide biosynthesis transport protein
MVESTDHTLHFHEYFRIVRNRLWVIFTIFILTVVSGAYVTEEILPKIYTATAQMQIKPRNITDITPFVEGGTDRSLDAQSFQAEYEIMQSPDVLLPIIDSLGLGKTWAKRVFKTNLETLPPLEALGYMAGVLHIDFKKGSNIIEVTASSEVPSEASDIANALVDGYKTKRDTEENERSNKGTDSLRDQIAQQQKTVTEKKAAVEKLRNDMGLVLMPGEQGQEDRLEVDLDTRQRDLLAAKVDADGRRVLLESVQNLPDEEYINTLQALGARSEPDIAALRAESFKIESDIDNLLKQGFDENHPRILAERAELDRHRQQIKDLIAATRRAMAVDAQVAQSRVALLSKEVDELKAKTIQDQTSQLGPFRDAQHEYERAQSVLDAYSIHLRQIEADRPLAESPVRIISRALPPDYPSKPVKSLNMAISVMAGLFMGIVVAFLIEYLDTSVKTLADAEILLGLPVLSVIPNKGGPMPMTQQAARLPHAEGYRILRAKLDLKVQNGMGPSLTMLSGGPGEGKSTTIYNLSVVCAQAGQSVILVDCDLRRPVIHELVQLPNERGLANYLRGEGDAVEYIQQTNMPNLHVLTAGDMAMADIGVLAGDKIRYMLDDLKQRYDLVLIDSPPVLGISDGSIIAREVDYVILVIQHRRYPREISLRAKRAIEEVHGNCVGMVLNSVSIKSDDSYYYYSSYGNYYNKKNGKAKKRKTAPKMSGKGKGSLVTSRKTELDSEEF